MVPKMMFGVIDVRDCTRAHIIAMTSPKAAGNISFGIGTDYKLLHRLLDSVFISIRVEYGENTRRQPSKLFGFRIEQPRISIETFSPLIWPKVWNRVFPKVASQCTRPTLDPSLCKPVNYD